MNQGGHLGPHLDPQMQGGHCPPSSSKPSKGDPAGRPLSQLQGQHLGHLLHHARRHRPARLQAQAQSRHFLSAKVSLGDRSRVGSLLRACVSYFYPLLPIVMTLYAQTFRPLPQHLRLRLARLARNVKRNGRMLSKTVVNCSRSPIPHAGPSAVGTATPTPISTTVHAG